MNVEVYVLDYQRVKEKTVTENVSAHGARLRMLRKLNPERQAVVACPNEGVWSFAKVIYCQRTAQNEFAVGLELSGRVEPWASAH